VDADPEVVVHRASLLHELLAPLPKGIMHANKKVVAIEPSCIGRHDLKILFQDGCAENFDAIIGADGIFGSVRSFVLEDHPEEHIAAPGGFWDCVNLVPFEKARTVLGDEYFQEDRQYGWVGDGAFLMHDVLENRSMVQCVVSVAEKTMTEINDRSRPVSKEILKNILKSWLDGPVAGGMIDVSEDHLFQDS
jgi:salicylate hydroxylase